MALPVIAHHAVAVGCYDLRHSLASAAYDLGLTDVEVARLLRHSNVQVTRTVYTGITDKAVTLGGKLAKLGGATGS